MSLDNIQLPPLLFQSMFQNKLVDFRGKPAVKKIKPTAKIDYLGGNEKNITLIICNHQNKFLDDKQLKFLSSLISACSITMADIALVNMDGNKEINYSTLSGALSGRKVLSFGVSTSDIGLPFTIPFYQVQAFQDVTYLFCPDLDQLQDNSEAKKLLWESLRKIFKIDPKK